MQLFFANRIMQTPAFLAGIGPAAQPVSGEPQSMERRDFVRACAAGAAVGASPVSLLAQSDLSPRQYERATLVDARGQPLKASAVPADRNLVFLYPYASTPCFLLNLGREIGPASLHTAERRSYRWPGGAGPLRSIVAYSAICTHLLTYPTRDISFISYRAARGTANRHAKVIHCCSEHSEYDPSAGGRVIGGPAPQPLAAILLDYDAKSDQLAAVGTLGGEVFNRFFEKYAFRLAMEHGASARKPVSGGVMVAELENYCRQQVQC